MKRISNLTLNEAIKLVRDNLEKGIYCPCCGQHAKEYKRKIHHTMAKALIYINNNFELWEWFHLEREFKEFRFNDLSKLRHWGLLEKKEGEREDGNPNNGYYRFTQKGKEFVMGKIRIPKYVYSYNDEILLLDNKETVDIKEALGKKFNYNELMENL